MPDFYFKNPPIVEAVCEMRFKASQQWDATAPGLFFTAMRDLLPNKKAVGRVNVTTPTSNQGMIERMFELSALSKFESEDGRRFVQMAPNYLSVHMLGPYAGWTPFRPLIERAIRSYAESAGEPAGVQRCGVRYINRIDFSGETNVDLKVFLNVYPELEESLPQQLVKARLEVVFPFIEDKAHLRLQVYTPDKPNDAAVFLDLDYATPETGSLAGIEDLLKWLDTAHIRLRDVFLATLKPTLRERFGFEEIASHA